MGGNTYHRQHFTDVELKKLIKKINGFKSLFNDKIFGTEKEWRANISRYLDSDSSNRFYFMIEELKGLPQCRACSINLTINSFNYSGYNKGFCKYCPECLSKEAWKFAANYSPTKLKDRRDKIQKRKLEFYQSEIGKQTAKTNGGKISTALKQFHSTEEGLAARKKSAEINSKIMRDKILTGKFTPNSNNRNTHWNSEFNGKKYRSSWEALYQYSNPKAEYETLRIPYIHNGKELIYIVDFIDHHSKIVVEVKPRELFSDKKVKSKIAALETWAKDHNYTMVIFDINEIKKIPEPDYQLFNTLTANKIKKIYATLKN